VVAGLLAFMLLLAGCGGDDDGGGGEELTELGKGEGQVNLIAWAGYVEPEWSKPFEQKPAAR
jgi:putative spermidine/putrescine transport system substrate-binding protein